MRRRLAVLLLQVEELEELSPAAVAELRLRPDPSRPIAEEGLCLGSRAEENELVVEVQVVVKPLKEESCEMNQGGTRDSEAAGQGRRKGRREGRARRGEYMETKNQNKRNKAGGGDKARGFTGESCIEESIGQVS